MSLEGLLRTYPARDNLSDEVILPSHLSVSAPFRPLGSVTTLACRIMQYLNQAGITVPRPGTHLFRYSCAQRLFEEGMPLKFIGDYLGHTQAHSTQRYTKIAIDQLREVGPAARSTDDPGSTAPECL